MKEMMMKEAPARIKMLVIDIDGTLLNPEGKITAYTRETILAARAEGLVVTLATGRRYGNTAPIAAELGIDCPLIMYDGALVLEHPHASILHAQSLEAKIAQEVVGVLARAGMQPVVHPAFHLSEEIWTGPAERDNVWIEAYFAAFPERMRRKPYAALCVGHADPLRVVTFAEEEAILQLLPAVEALECSGTWIRRGNYGSAELAVMRKGCSKASGVEALARTLNITMAEVMALGDNNNDVEMLAAAGWGVAMGQASEHVKAAADATTWSNAEEGAARAIECYALRSARHAASNSRKRSICL